MPESCFFAITLLLILWIFTVFALLRFYRQARDKTDKISEQPSDLIIALLNQGKKEAQEARRRLTRLADAFFIGLIEINSSGQMKGLNPVAAEALEHGPEIESSIRNLGTAGQETVVRTDNGKVFQLRRLEAGKSSELVVIQEVTQTYQWMERVKSREKLALLGQMTAQIAHQLKTPLAVLAGQAQMLAKHLINQKDLEIRARAIYDEARGLAEQVSEISAFYRNKGPSPTETELSPLLEQVKSRLNPLINKQEIFINCPQNLVIKTDPSLLKNLLFLMGQNALEPQVGARKVTISARPLEDKVIIGIEDDGKGIPEKLKSRIFEPFVGTREDGLGLGLFLAKDLVRQLQGNIYLAKAPQGTRFEISLPL